MELSFYHLCTSEDHADFLISDSDFKTAINVLALCVALFSGLEIYCFEFMSNHMHFLLHGSSDTIETFFRFYIKVLSKSFKAEGKVDDITDLSYKCYETVDRNHLLNSIVYIHRNASVVDNKLSPYTYKWGTGRYYFNPEARARYNSVKQKVTMNQRQLFSHSRKFDGVADLYTIDNYISPFCFCKIVEGENLFSGAGQYLYMLTKNIESSRSISKEIGEQITYSDYELYPVMMKIADKMFQMTDIGSLSVNQKLHIAKVLHYDYNSNNKQICRLLKINITVVNDLFPQSSVYKSEA